MSKPSWFKSNAALFFPEMLPAAYVVLISPIWEVQLLGRGRMAAALVLPLGVVVGSCGFYWARREKSRWLAYTAILGLLLTALATYKLGK
jgi:hypothetical protein